MVEYRIVPALRLVAAFASLRQVHYLVVRPLGRLVVLFVAGDAVCIQSAPQFMAVCAGHCGMGTGQGKFFSMILGCFQPLIPPHNRVALFAVAPLFPPVNVRMTVGTFLPDICKHQISVAERAVRILMQPSERVARFLMIEIRGGSDGRPARTGVTVQAIEAQGTVRIVHLSLHLLLGCSRSA